MATKTKTKKQTSALQEQSLTDALLAAENAKLEKKSFRKLLDQVNSEYVISYNFMKPKWEEWGLRLKLYNNQKRDKEKVGDPLLFTVHQTVIASLYDDRMTTTFAPREQGDTDVASNTTDLAEYDYSEMGKDELDYYSIWDASFFGHSVTHMAEWDSERKCPVPELIDPMTLLRDPRAVSVNGDMRRRNAARFLGWEFRLSMNEMKEEGVYFNLDKLKSADGDSQSIVDRNRQLRAEAQGHGDYMRSNASVSGENKEYRLLLWYTMYNGKRVRVVTAADRMVVIRYEVLDSKDIPMIDRVLYPLAHDWDGVSVPDLVEDKQRARSVIINLGLAGAKSALHPMYVFDTNKIKNKNDLNFGFNKNVPVDGPVTGAIEPIQRTQIQQGSQFILDLLDVAAQKATAASAQQQGVSPDTSKTAYEVGVTQQNTGTRFSLSAKIFGWSEKKFWKRWYQMYKENFNSDIDEKVIRIVGPINMAWRTLTRDQFIAHTDPDVIIESKALAEAQRQKTAQGFMNYLNLVITIPGANRTLAARQLGELQGLHKDVVFGLLPLSVHELKAQDENVTLGKNKIVEVDVSDDDILHIFEHNKLKDTAAKYAHIRAHYRSMMVKQMNPDIAGQQGGPMVQNPELLSKTSAPVDPNASGTAPAPTPRPMPTNQPMQ